MAAYDAVLFDQDGVLVEPPAPETQARATREAFAAAGADEIDEGAVADIVEGTTIDRIQEIAATHDLDPAVLWEAREHHDEQSQFAAFRAGDRAPYEDVGAVADRSQPCGVVSNNHDSTVRFVLDFFDFAPWFDTVRGRAKTLDSLRRKKPAPDYLERARSALDAETVLYVGDSAGDVLAAHRAGMDAALLRRPHNRGLAPESAPAHEITPLHALPDVVG